jgi:hypothetical protein
MALNNTVEFPFKVFPHVMFNFSVCRVNNFIVKFCPFKIFLSLVLKSTGLQRNFEWGFHCNCYAQVRERMNITMPGFLRFSACKAASVVFHYLSIIPTN